MEEETLNLKNVTSIFVIDKRKDKTICDGKVEKFEIVELEPAPRSVNLHLDTGYRVSLWLKEEKE